MKFRFSNFYLRLGASPTETENFISIKKRESNALIRVAACAEEFYVGLGYYMEISVALRGLTDFCWFELQRTRRRLPSEVAKGIGTVGYTRHGSLYGNISPEDVRTLLNEFWQSDRFRIIGTSQISTAAAVELAKTLDKGLHDDAVALPTSVMFVLERQYFNDEPFLAVLVDNQILNTVRELLSHATVRLQHPLLEVGPEAWPPRA